MPTEPPDGAFELRPSLPVAADQRWFWADRWQAREREVDQLVVRGEVAFHPTTDAFLTYLDVLDR
ncbi:MAG: hypothetical protein LBI33_13075 [Propionibacteriaceae bacterium]|nr:hypothetical protein [Propionibacteriaceae bacterium]